MCKFVNIYSILFWGALPLPSLSSTLLEVVTEVPEGCKTSAGANWSFVNTSLFTGQISELRKALPVVPTVAVLFLLFASLSNFYICERYIHLYQRRNIFWPCEK